MEFFEVTAPTDMNVQSADGIHGARLVAGVPTRVNALLYRAALLRGCSIPGAVTEKPAEAESDVVEKLVVAMQMLIDAGDPSKINKGTGEPKAVELKKFVLSFTAEQRAAAWNKVLAAEAGGEPDPIE